MSDLELSVPERRALERQLRSTHDARVYRRTLAVLEVAEGEVVEEVARRVHMTRRSVHRWLAAYRVQPSPESLEDKPGRGRHCLFGPADRACLEQCLRQKPCDLGYWANDWTVPLLREHLEAQGLPGCSCRTLYRELEELDQSFKRPRHVLPPDPEKEKKTPATELPEASASSQCGPV